MNAVLRGLLLALAACAVLLGLASAAVSWRLSRLRTRQFARRLAWQVGLQALAPHAPAPAPHPAEPHGRRDGGPTPLEPGHAARPRPGRRPPAPRTVPIPLCRTRGERGRRPHGRPPGLRSRPGHAAP